MQAKANLFRTLVVLPVVLLVAVAVALFGLGLRTGETQTTTPKMQVHDLGTLGGNSSLANGINDSGKVVGSSYLSDGRLHAFLYDETATPKMQDLNDLIPADSGWTINEATAINSDGKIAAYGVKYAQGYSYANAVVLTPATTDTYEVQDLATLLSGGYSGPDSVPTGINDSGQVVGTAYYGDTGGNYAFLYDEGATPKMQYLGDLTSAGSQAEDINDSGQVVGGAGVPPDYMLHAVIYEDGEMKDLGTLVDYIFSIAKAINDSGQVVGSSTGLYNSSGESHAVIYDSTTGMKDLNGLIPADSGWTINEARAISSDGKMAAYGSKAGVGQHALLLTPVPDTTAPKVDSFTPYPDGVTRVSLSTPITATFSEDMNPNTLTKSTFTLTKKGSTTPLGATVSYKDKTATLQPSSALNRNATYTATVKGGANGVKDKAGNALASDKVWSFTTGGK